MRFSTTLRKVISLELDCGSGCDRDAFHFLGAVKVRAGETARALLAQAEMEVLMLPGGR